MRELIKWGLLFSVTLLVSCTHFENRTVLIESFDELDTSQEDFEVFIPSVYYLAPGDVVEVQFPYRMEMNDRYSVGPDGSMSLTILGSIQAAGKTLNELQTEVREKYYELSASSNKNSGAEKEYRINVGDELEIRFSNPEDFTESAVVRPDGKISLPLIGEVDIEHKTPKALETELTSLYRNDYNNPELVVIVREYTSDYFYVEGEKQHLPFNGLDDAVLIMRQTSPMQVFVGGEVARPTFFDYTGPITAIQAIIKAGGVTKAAETEQIVVLRREPNKKSQLILRDLKINAISRNEAIDEGGMLSSLAGDFQLSPYDVLIVPQKKVSRLRDFLDSYVYDLIPALRNSSLSFIYQINDINDVSTVTP